MGPVIKGSRAGEHRALSFPRENIGESGSDQSPAKWGSRRQERRSAVQAPLRGHNQTPNAANRNADGELDLIVGAEDGFLYYFERSFIEGAARPQRD